MITKNSEYQKTKNKNETTAEVDLHQNLITDGRKERKGKKKKNLKNSKTKVN